MRTIATGRMKTWLIAMAMVGATASGWATLLQDKGVFLAGSFPTPDIHQPPSASAEAVFLAGSTANAPLFLNELVVAPDGSGCAFSNNGWVDGSFFTASAINDGSSTLISWNLSGTNYALTFVSVNFNNDFYHVYNTSPSFRSEGQVVVTGNLREVIAHIHFFGVSTAPDSASTLGLLGISVSMLVLFRRHLVRN